MTTEIGRVKCWNSTERLRQKEVLGRETGMVYNVKTTTITTVTKVTPRSRKEKKGILFFCGRTCSAHTTLYDTSWDSLKHWAWRYPPKTCFYTMSSCSHPPSEVVCRIRPRRIPQKKGRGSGERIEFSVVPDSTHLCIIRTPEARMISNDECIHPLARFPQTRTTKTQRSHDATT